MDLSVCFLSFCTCTKLNMTLPEMQRESWNSERNQEQGLPQSLIWTPCDAHPLFLECFQDSPWVLSTAWRTLSCWSCTWGMLPGTVWDFFFFLQYLVLYQRGVNTSFQCCDQVLPLSQQLTITFGGWELLWLSKRGFKERYLPSFLNYVSYKLHWLCWTYYFSKEIF